MKSEIQFKSFLAKFIGITIVFGNLYWTYYNLNLFYLYHFTSVLFVVKISDSVLIFNAILGISGIFIGIAVLKGHFVAVKWFMIDIGILIFGILLIGLNTM